MNYGIVLFIYNIPQCTKQVLESIRRNSVKELYVFQDGLGKEEDREKWEENEKLIRQIDWCNVIYEQRQLKSSSLDTQIIYGIDKVFEHKEAIIVIEDDCIISGDCIEFMEKCFYEYKDNKKVIDITAYLEPIEIPKDYKWSIISTGRPGGQVWGTWKDRWNEFKKDYDIIKRIGKMIKHNESFSNYGCDIKNVFSENEAIKTWDIWWAINIFEKEGVSIRPVHNKVYNIGFENPGTHTSGESPYIVTLGEEGNLDFFPNNVSS